MAVVYRGHDTSLKREVAVKVLHQHLAEHQEARERFGREAHAVAKLRHENILEIHDFSGVDSKENYIVTEFINGSTLKEFIDQNPIHFPEIGAMIVVQVCRALSHAHGLGVLHRDVKPENIMIRADGMVKLTDFGIAQMVDLRRMTVTGQLLGSPAYMSPEHVEGKELDFRTDEFGVGIVLYQLVTGELPFSGKNPHEILKRIGDCVYPDPCRVNPRVGKELGGIIEKALAKNPADRYADIALMQQALEAYLEGCGLEDLKGELERFFNAPGPYQVALKPRLVDYLYERGKKLLPSKRAQALELFNRVLSIDENNAEVLGYLNREGARRRNFKIAAIVTGIGFLVSLSVLAKRRFAAGPAKSSSDAAVAESFDGMAMAVGIDAQPPQPDAMPLVVPATIIDAAVEPSATPDAKPRPIKIRKKPDASVEAPKKEREFKLILRPNDSEYRIGDQPWKPAPNQGTFPIRVPEGVRRVISVRKPSCCQEAQRTISPEQPGTEITIQLAWLPGRVTPVCSVPGVQVTINGNIRKMGESADIPVTRFVGSEPVELLFYSKDRAIPKTVTVKAKQTLEVPCPF
jgi:serine/threonine-protein kinase